MTAPFVVDTLNNDPFPLEPQRRRVLGWSLLSCWSCFAPSNHCSYSVCTGGREVCCLDSQPQGTLSTVRVNQGHSLDCSDLIVDCTNLFRLGDTAAGAAGRQEESVQQEMSV